MKVLQSFLPSCEACSNPSFKLFCQECLRKFRFQNACGICGCYLSASKWSTCLSCQNTNVPWQKLWISFVYAEGVETWIRNIKKYARYSAWRELDSEHLPAELIERPFDRIAYVPNDPYLTKSRGFESSFTLGKRISRLLGGIPLERDIFQRKTFLKAQHELAVRERAKQISALIQLQRQPKGQRILLVDDVMTSGNSVRHCARLLKKAGLEVEVYVVARRLKAPLTLYRTRS